MIKWRKGRRYPGHGERATCGNTARTGSTPVLITKSSQT